MNDFVVYVDKYFLCNDVYTLFTMIGVSLMSIDLGSEWLKVAIVKVLFVNFQC